MTEQTSNPWNELVQQVLADINPSGLSFSSDISIFRRIGGPLVEAIARLRKQVGVERDDLVIFVPNHGWSTDAGPDGTFMGVRLRSCDIDWPVVGVEVRRG